MLDLILFLYLFWRMTAGLTSKPSAQVNALLVRLLIIGALSGFFLISQLTGLIRNTFEVITAESGILMTSASLVIAIILLIQLKTRVIEKLDQLIAQRLHIGVSIGISLLHGLIIIWVSLTILQAFPLGLFDSLLANSMIVQWLK